MTVGLSFTNSLFVSARFTSEFFILLLLLLNKAGTRWKLPRLSRSEYLPMYLREAPPTHPEYSLAEPPFKCALIDMLM